LIVGGAIGIWEYRKNQRKADEVIDQIKEQCKEE
jgi:hypothetical protein